MPRTFSIEFVVYENEDEGVEWTLTKDNGDSFSSAIHDLNGFYQFSEILVETIEDIQDNPYR